MFSLPEKYQKNANIPKVTFVRGASLTGADKKRFETAVEDIRLLYQIEGFDIPNLVNDEYNVQVIMFIRIRVKQMKQAAFIAKIVQKCMPTLAVLELTDGVDAQYSFADKRLNKTDERLAVVENEYITGNLPLDMNNDLKTTFSMYLDHDTILNRSNKHLYYVEMMTKAFLIFDGKVYPRAQELLDSRIWYDESRLTVLFPRLTALRAARQKASKAVTVSEKSTANRQIKEILTELEGML